MLKKSIKFEDLDGNPMEDVFYFNLNKAELIKWMVSEKGGIQSYLERIIEAKDNKEIVALLDGIILKSVGRRHADNIQFVKSPEITQEFMQSEAYVNLFVEFFEDENAGAAFVNAIIPAALAKEVDAELAKRAATETVELPQPVEAGAALLALNRDLTQDEIRKLTTEQQAEAYRAKMARDAVKPPA